MKLQGILGKGTGKLGNAVFAVSGGEQIMREYNPNVSNPNTDAQVAQRAKLKLMSQLGAALAPALGFAKMGLVSARNQFVSANIGICSFSNNEATCDVTGLQLTPSKVAFPQVTASGTAEGLSVLLGGTAPADVKRVMYVVYEQTNGDQLRYIANKVVGEAGERSTFPTSFSSTVIGNTTNVVVYAYGIKDNNTSATIRYEDYVAAQGSIAATLDVTTLFRSADYSLTKTTGVVVEL